MAEYDELIEQAVERANRKVDPKNRPSQDMAFCIRFAVKDLEIEGKPISGAAVKKRALELFEIHG